MHAVSELADVTDGAFDGSSDGVVSQVNHRDGGVDLECIAQRYCTRLAESPILFSCKSILDLGDCCVGLERVCQRHSTYVTDPSSSKRHVFGTYGI
jgi:hypothetical protein